MHTICPNCGGSKSQFSTVCRECYLLARRTAGANCTTALRKWVAENRECYLLARRTAGANCTTALRKWVAENRSKPSDDQIQNAFEDINSLAAEIADALAPELLISECYPVGIERETWYDLNTETGSDLGPVSLVYATELRYCEARKLLRHHPTKPNLVQVIED